MPSSSCRKTSGQWSVHSPSPVHRSWSIHTLIARSRYRCSAAVQKPRCFAPVRLIEIVDHEGERPTIAFHPELTVVGDLDPRARLRFIDRIDRAAAAVGKGTELHY